MQVPATHATRVPSGSWPHGSYAPAGTLARQVLAPSSPAQESPRLPSQAGIFPPQPTPTRVPAFWQVPVDALPATAHDNPRSHGCVSSQGSFDDARAAQVLLGLMQRAPRAQPLAVQSSPRPGGTPQVPHASLRFPLQVPVWHWASNAHGAPVSPRPLRRARHRAEDCRGNPRTGLQVDERVHALPDSDGVVARFRSGQTVRAGQCLAHQASGRVAVEVLHAGATPVALSARLQFERSAQRAAASSAQACSTADLLLTVALLLHAASRRTTSNRARSAGTSNGAASAGDLRRGWDFVNPRELRGVLPLQRQAQPGAAGVGSQPPSSTPGGRRTASPRFAGGRRSTRRGAGG